MSDICETVVIETKNGEVIINKSDYDSKIHTLAGQKKEAKPKPKKGK